MDILQNELVKKYFSAYGNGETMAQRVLSSMQEPIRKGERYLEVNKMNEELRIRKNVWSDDDCGSAHFYELRLPDTFQKKESIRLHHFGGCCCLGQPNCICNCHEPFQKRECEHCDDRYRNIGHIQCCLCGKEKPQRDEVEETIKELSVTYSVSPQNQKNIESALRELVRLVREGK